MSRLATEFQRLYAAGPSGERRALVLDVGRPSDWELLGQVWREVQLALSLPAPAIAIAGANSYQLWFSVERGVTPAEGIAFLEALSRRYLTGIAPTRVRCLTEPPAMPAEVKEGQWSAFVAPDLAPVFVEATWLDIPPGAEGQADLLKPLKPITPQEWEAAGELLREKAEKPLLATAPSQPTLAGPSTEVMAPSTAFTDPRAFLLHVMNDATVPMALRIEAAKALIQESGRS